MTRLLRRPSPALVVACLALLVALGGTSYATVANVPKNSVGTAHLKPNAVISAKVRNRSLLAVDFRVGQLPAGPAGPAGPKGDKGDKGDTGATGVAEYQIVQGNSATNSTSKSVTVTCPAGKKVVGGGAVANTGIAPNSPTTAWISGSFPPSDTEWRAIGIEAVGYAGNWAINAYAICAKVT